MKRPWCETYKKQVDEDTAEKSSKVIDIRKVTAEKKDSIVTEVFSYINSKKHIAVLLGAGISVDSGIPDFRSKNGFFSIIKNKIPSQYSPEDVFDADVFREDPSLFYKSIQYIYSNNPKPSASHLWLQTLPVLHLFTQNIDGLESCIDCPKTYLHGTLSTGTCQKCGMKMNQQQLSSYYNQGKVARCCCEGIVKPDIVFYGDIIENEVLATIETVSKECDLLLVMGTSLSTYPVSQYIECFKDCDIIVMNQTNVVIPHRRDDLYTIQLLGSFEDLLNHQSEVITDSIQTIQDKKFILLYKSGILKKRKYLSEWAVIFYVYYCSSEKGMIQSLISKLLYLPPQCSYFRYDGRFLGTYFEIKDELGESIPCVYFKSKTPSRYTIVYSHANAEDLGYLADFFIWLTKCLYVDVIGYDYPGYGLYRRTPSEESVKNCACSVINYVIDTLNISPEHIILYGHSLGSAVSVFLSVFVSKTRDHGVAGVILQSCFMSIYRIVFDIRFSAKKDQYETIDIIKDIGSPVTFIHGIDDIVVPLSHPKRLFALVPSHLRFRCLFVETAGHNNIECCCKPRSIFVNHLLDFITFISRLQDSQ